MTQPRVRHDLVDGAKPCTRCRRTLPLDSFCKSKWGPHGRNWYCRDCKAASDKRYMESPAARERCRAYQREWQRGDKQRERKRQYMSAESARHRYRIKKLERQYGLTESQFNEMLLAQGGACGICREPLNGTRQTNIDHDHATGRVRGVLCTHCNRGLGGARDRVEVLRSMIEYLEAHVVRHTEAQ